MEWWCGDTEGYRATELLAGLAATALSSQLSPALINSPQSTLLYPTLLTPRISVTNICGQATIISLSRTKSWWSFSRVRDSVTAVHLYSLAACLSPPAPLLTSRADGCLPGRQQTQYWAGAGAGGEPNTAKLTHTLPPPPTSSYLIPRQKSQPANKRGAPCVTGWTRL